MHQMDKNELKYIQSFAQKKHWLQESVYLIEGPKLLEEALKSNVEIKKIYANRDKTVMNRVVQQVMEELNTPQPYILYTSTPRIQQWLDNHSSEQYCIEGEYDVLVAASLFNNLGFSIVFSYYVLQYLYL
jgi:tRNA G18 (ribose-2'-O)-methylase SpoU